MDFAASNEERRDETDKKSADGERSDFMRNEGTAACDESYLFDACRADERYRTGGFAVPAQAIGQRRESDHAGVGLQPAPRAAPPARRSAEHRCGVATTTGGNTAWEFGLKVVARS